nr:putative integron gene cassette protein [uncultured bacterium]
MSMQTMSKHLLVGIAVPVILLVNAFLIPEPYSHPLIHLGLAPTKLMPFLENRELMANLTEFVFGRMTPNFAPIQILFLITFWFAASATVSLVVAKFKKVHKNA